MERRAPLTPEQVEMLVKIVYSADKGQYIGPYLIGVVLDLFLLGIAINQFNYYWRYCRKEDRLFTKIVLYVTMVLTIACSIFCITYIMRLFVYNFGVYTPMADPHWPQLFAVGDSLICPLTQFIYVDRAYKLLANTHRFPLHKFFLGLMIVLMICELVSGISAIIYVNLELKSLLDAFKIAPFLYAALTSSMVADLTITLFTSYALSRSKTGWSHTDSTIYKLIRLLLETQAPPTIMTIGFAIYYARYGASSIIIAFDIIMTKPYVIGLLGILNSRRSIRKTLYSQSRSGNAVLQNTYPSRHNEVSRFRGLQITPFEPFAPGVTPGTDS